MSIHKVINRVTTESFLNMKFRGEKISMITAYDFTTAKMLDASGVDAILVGDSAANVMAGHSSTLPITLEQMIYHAQCVTRGTERTLVIVDLPFGSYQSNPQKALDSAVKIMKKTNAQAVKLEGGKEIADSLYKIINAGIPVMGHLGLTPQSIHKLGSYGVQAKEDSKAQKLLEDAKLLEELGCFSIVLEKIPSELAKRVSESVKIPTIGIGAGNYCDGQVLVFQDMIGMNKDFKPKFVRKYLNLYDDITAAVSNYVKDVKDKDFPNSKESY